MALYNVNKDTGDITETAGKYGSSNSVFYGTIAEWNQLTTAEKKAYDHASIPDSLDGNVTFPASKVMMNDGASVEDVITASVFGAYVDVSSYVSTNKYTFPSDGYLYVVARGADNTIVSVSVEGANNSGTIGISAYHINGKNGLNSMYVRKGMKVYVNRLESTDYVRFYPFV